MVDPAADVCPACTDDAAVEGADDGFATALQGSDAFLQGAGVMICDGFSTTKNGGLHDHFS